MDVQHRTGQGGSGPLPVKSAELATLPKADRHGSESTILTNLGAGPSAYASIRASISSEKSCPAVVYVEANS